MENSPATPAGKNPRGKTVNVTALLHYITMLDFTGLCAFKAVIGCPFSTS